MNFLEIYFSTREIAYIILSLVGIVVFVVLGIYQKVSFTSIVKASLNPKVSVPISGYILYTLVWFYLGFSNNWWDERVLGTLALWLISTGGIGLLFKVVKSFGEENVFRKALIKSFSLMTIFIYMGGIYTRTSLMAEILLALLSLFLTFLIYGFRKLAVSSIGDRLTGMLLLSLLLFNFAHSINTLNATPNNDWELILDKFILPAAMTAVSIPYLYLLGLYCSYEDLIKMIRVTNSSNTRFSTYILSLISICGFSNTRVRKFRKRVLYIRPDGKNFKEARKVLKSVENVDFTTGEY